MLHERVSRRAHGSERDRGAFGHVEQRMRSVGEIEHPQKRELQVGHDTHGAVITGIKNGSVGDSLGFERGDIIVSIDQRPVEDAEDAAQMLRKAADSPQKNALLLINRHGETRYVGIDLSHNQG